MMIPQEHIRAVAASDDTPAQNVTPISLDERVREFEAGLISWALRVSRGNKSQAARLLKIKRSTLGDRINRCGLGGSPAEAAAREKSA
jgi:two-component system, NtrC family, response regulator HydG